MFEIFQYSFIIRGLEAGIIIAVIAPLIGIYLVLKRYSLIADTLAHVSLAGIALGILLKLNLLFSALAATLLSSIIIEKMRISKKIYSESALAVFLSGSLALAVILINLAHGLNTDLFNYLFGSIVTVKQSDVYVISILGTLVIFFVIGFSKELKYVAFDEEAAKVSGIPTKAINFILISLSAVTVSLAIPIVGVLLISALLVIPVITAMQFRKSFNTTIMIAEALSVFSVLAGIISSFYLNLSAGGMIVLIMISFLLITFIMKSIYHKSPRLN